MKYIAKLLLLLMLSAPTYAAWFLSYPNFTDQQVEISDAAREFTIGGMRCGVEATHFARAPDDSILQSRNLYCWVSPDRYVFVTANCSAPSLYELTTLGIRIGNIEYQPGLVCGPSKNAKP